MSPIIPAIIPKTFRDIEERCADIAPFIHEIQIDVVDGTFVPFVSWPYNKGDSIQDLSSLADDFLIEMDLMIQNPEETVEAYIQAGVRRIVVHIESTDKIQDIHRLKEKYDFRLGLSLNNDTEIQKLYEVIEYADYIQVMGIKEIGAQGQPFDNRVLDRVRELREKFSRLLISIDGSVNSATLPNIARSGVDRCVVGSALLKSENIQKAHKELEDIFLSVHNTLV